MSSYVDPVASQELPLEDIGELRIEDGPLEARRTVLPSGVRVFTEYVPGTRSATVGMWFPVGSRDETSTQGGAAHFLEHLLFKGTRKRDSLEIALSFDEVGGESNAATAKESTHYYARVVDEDTPMAIDVLADMVTSSLLDDDDVEMERGVILDELAMAEDSPGEVAQEAFFKAAFGDTPLGRPIGGSPESVQGTTGEEIRHLYQAQYTPAALTVAAAGNVDHEQVCELVSRALDEADWKQPGRGSRRSEIPARLPDVSSEVVLRDVEQAHLLVGGRWLKASDEERPVSSVMTTLLGGGTSSRLFQEIREKRGLAYTTYAFDVAFSDSGLIGMYAGCAPDKVRQVEEIIWDEIEKLAAGRVSEEELHRVRGQIRGGLALGMEDSAARMSRLGRSELSGRFVSIDGALERINAVTPENVIEMAQKLLSIPRARAVVMPDG